MECLYRHIFLEDTSSNTKVTPKTVSLSLSHISPMCVETSPSDLVCGFYMNQIHEVLKCKMVIGDYVCTSLINVVLRHVQTQSHITSKCLCNIGWVSESLCTEL